MHDKNMIEKSHSRKAEGGEVSDRRRRRPTRIETEFNHTPVRLRMGLIVADSDRLHAITHAKYTVVLPDWP